MIYTSYFAKINKLPDNIIPISICGKAPDWYTGLQYKKLSPKYGFFIKWKQNHDNEFYIEHFYDEVLNHLIADEIVYDLYQKIGIDLNNSNSNEKQIALICYEKPSDFCHRHLVADWLTEYGYETKEYIYD